MSANSSIEWTEHTHNPWWGCEKVSPGCTHCYAETWAKRTGFKIWGQDSERRFFGDKHWSQPLKWDAAARKLGVMHRVFCGSMCDIFEDRMDLDTHRIRAFRMPSQTPNLLWLFLTKRANKPVQMLPREWMEQWPRNVMIGFTIEDQKRLDERTEHIELLRRCFPGVSVFASCEPLLSPLEWRVGNRDRLEMFDWVIGGGESGPGARPMHPEWVTKLRNDCANRTDMGRPWPVPFLFKQWGEYAPVTLDDRHGSIAPAEKTELWVHPDGSVSDRQGVRDFAWPMQRIGKKAAGRMLQFRTCDGLPTLPYGPQLPGVENYGACQVRQMPEVPA